MAIDVILVSRRTVVIGSSCSDEHRQLTTPQTPTATMAWQLRKRFPTFGAWSLSGSAPV